MILIGDWPFFWLRMIVPTHYHQPYDHEEAQRSFHVVVKELLVPPTLSAHAEQEENRHCNDESLSQCAHILCGRSPQEGP